MAQEATADITLKKFPKLRPVGHPETDGLSDDGRVTVLEKMDGANFRFRAVGDRIVFGSRNVVYKNETDIANAFTHAVEFIRERVDASDLNPDRTYFGEAMHEHTIDYDWDNTPSVLAFDSYDHRHGEFVGWVEGGVEFVALGLPTVPVVQFGQSSVVDADYHIPESAYRDGVAEGVVFYHSNGTRAKLRSEEFREKHDGNTASPEDDTGHGTLVDTYCTDTRIDKRIDDLLDEGHTLSRELMGEGLPQAVSRDIFEEHAHEIVAMNETVDLKEYRSAVAKECLDRIDDRMAERAGGA